MRLGRLGSTATAGRDCGPGPVITPTFWFGFGLREIESRSDRTATAPSEISNWKCPSNIATAGVATAETFKVSLPKDVIAVPGRTPYRSTKNRNRWREPMPIRKVTDVDAPLASDATGTVWMSPATPAPLSALTSLSGWEGLRSVPTLLMSVILK